MTRKTTPRWWTVCGAAALTLSSGLSTRADDAPAPKDGADPSAKRTRVLHSTPFQFAPFGVRIAADTPNVLFYAEAQAGEEAPKRFWIGLQCAAVPPAVRAQLGLAEGKGLLVEEVVAESPAAKAGIRPHDVIVSFGEQEIVKQEDLGAAVQAAGTKETSITLLRGGKEQAIAVTPAEMPGAAAHIRDAGEARRWMERFEGPLPGQRVEDVLRFHLVQPGVRVEIGAPAELPEGYKATIVKEGKEPATVTVEKDDKSWKATEKNLEELPEDVRPWVRRSLGVPFGPHVIGNAQVRKIPSPPAIVIPGPHGWNRPFHAAPNEPVEKRLDDAVRRLEELRRTIEELRKDLPKQPAPPREPPTGKTSA